MNEPLPPAVRYEELPVRYASAESQGRLDALRAQMVSFQREDSVAVQMKGIGYGWGRQDAPGYQPPTHRGGALDFGIALALHYAGDTPTMAIREAYDAWHATGRIGR